LNTRIALWSIYALVCPLTGLVKYIGITSTSLDTRLRYHLRGKDHNPQKEKWISWLHSQELLPLIIPIDSITGTRKQAEQKERQYIWAYIQQGYTLFNIQYIPGPIEDFAEFLREQPTLLKERF